MRCDDPWAQTGMTVRFKKGDGKPHEVQSVYWDRDPKDPEAVVMVNLGNTGAFPIDDLEPVPGVPIDYGED